METVHTKRPIASDEFYNVLEYVDHDISFKRKVRLLSYNIHVGIEANRYRHYVTKSWKYVLPHKERNENLNSIAGFVKGFDIVGLQELDGGSLRSSFVNHTEFLAEKAGFPYWYDTTNRKIGKFSHHSIGVLTRIMSIGIDTYKLPGRVPGRGVLVVKFGRHDNPLVIIIAHLSLGKYSRMLQIDFMSELLTCYKNVILMGDLNCGAESREVAMLVNKTGLHPPVPHLHTFPSWNPKKKLDHILVSPTIQIEKVNVLKYNLSDHLPIAMDVILPDDVCITV